MGPFDRERAKEAANRPKSVLHDETIREGVVIKPYGERYNENGRIILKLTSEEYDHRKGKRVTEYQ